MILTRLYGGSAREAIAALAPIYPERARGALLDVLEVLDTRRRPGIVSSVAIIQPVRTQAQNRLYFGWLRIVGDELGYGPEEVQDLHYGLKRLLLGTRETPLGPVPISTKKLSVVDFSAYLENVRRVVLNEFAIRLPDASEFDAYLAAKSGGRSVH